MGIEGDKTLEPLETWKTVIVKKDGAKIKAEFELVKIRADQLGFHGSLSGCLDYIFAEAKNRG